MTQSINTFDLVDLLRTGSDVQTTIYELGDATIRRSSKDDLSILSVSGTYSRAIAKEIERLALQVRGNLGIEFAEVRGIAPRGKRFDSSVIGLLKTLKERFQLRGKHFFLCSPPQDLLDLLKLTGTIGSYMILDPSGAAALPAGNAASPASKAQAPLPSPHQEIVQRRIVNLNASLKRTQSLEKGLDSAKSCVQRFLPQNEPEVPGYSFAFAYRSSEKVGGDFFDFVPLGDGLLGVVIGDVSGHGLDAALIMGISKKVINMRAREAGNGSPLEVLWRVNEDLVPDFKRYSFVTVLYGILETDTGKFTFCRAGHEHPILFGEGLNAHAIEARGLPLGTDWRKRSRDLFEERTVEIPLGGYLLLCTDGLAESRNDRGTIFSRERLRFSLDGIALSSSARLVLDRVLQGVRDFCGTREQEDDVTTILIHRLAERRC